MITVSCDTCDTTYRFSVLDRDEDGEPTIPTQKCAEPTCEVLLCEGGCLDHFSFECDGCGKRFCNEHMIVVEHEEECSCSFVGDSADAGECRAHNRSLAKRPDRFCVACAEQTDEVEWPEIPKLQPITAKVQYPNIPEFGGTAA